MIVAADLATSIRVGVTHRDYWTGHQREYKTVGLPDPASPIGQLGPSWFAEALGKYLSMMRSSAEGCATTMFPVAAHTRSTAGPLQILNG
jgi:hypothetical protein